MSLIRPVLFLLYFSVPLMANSAVTNADLPNGTLWYLHADLKQMRSAKPGQVVYQWLDGEVFVEVYDEVGIDINKEVDSITAYSHSDSGTVILIEGNMRPGTQEKLLESARKESNVTESKHKGKTYFFINDRHDVSIDYEDDHEHRRRRRDPLVDLKDGAYVSFAIDNKFLVTGSEAQMQDLLDNNGKLAGGGDHKGALFVLTADKAFVQAGLNTGELDDDGGWDSNILRNTEQAALTIAGIGDMISIEAQLVSTDPAMAQSLGGIANGLKAFNSDLDPEIKSLLANTKIEVNDNVLSISTVIMPDIIVRTLER
jgi:hypothetical protein